MGLAWAVIGHRRRERLGRNLAAADVAAARSRGYPCALPIDAWIGDSRSWSCCFSAPAHSAFLSGTNCVDLYRARNAESFSRADAELCRIDGSATTRIGRPKIRIARCPTWRSARRNVAISQLAVPAELGRGTRSIRGRGMREARFWERATQTGS